MALDITAARSAIVTGLPIRTRWMLRGTHLDFDFSSARRGLRKVTSEDIIGDIDEAWADLLIFGNYDFSEGGGASPWLTIRESDDSVCGLDAEREQAIFEYNSSLERFIETFNLLDRYLTRCQPQPKSILATVQDIDPEGFPTSDWRFMLDSLIDE